MRIKVLLFKVFGEVNPVANVSPTSDGLEVPCRGWLSDPVV